MFSCDALVFVFHRESIELKPIAFELSTLRASHSFITEVENQSSIWSILHSSLAPITCRNLHRLLKHFYEFILTIFSCSSFSLFSANIFENLIVTQGNAFIRIKANYLKLWSNPYWILLQGFWVSYQDSKLGHPAYRKKYPDR